MHQALYHIRQYIANKALLALVRPQHIIMNITDGCKTFRITKYWL